jgi:hypothetical protein
MTRVDYLAAALALLMAGCALYGAFGRVHGRGVRRKVD